MRTTMSFASRRELLAKVAPRYRDATRKQKTVILNEFISSAGYKRKYAIRRKAYDYHDLHYFSLKIIQAFDN